MESSTKINSTNSSDGIAVSRSGRVRKKSTKLTDFESSDDVEVKLSPKKCNIERNIRPPPNNKDDDLDGDLSDFDEIDIKEEDDWDLPDDDNSFLDVKLTEDDFRDDQDLDPLSLCKEELDFCDDDFDVDYETNDPDDAIKEEGSAGGVAQSLYFSEKQAVTKKGYYNKDGRRKKAQRKDKGKSRFTAYMLWAREIRPNIIKKHPEMDFSSVNKKLGELWQLVPTKQKYNWKRRAKRLAVRLRQGGMISTGKPCSSKPAAVVSRPGSVPHIPLKLTTTAEPVPYASSASGPSLGALQAGKKGSSSRGSKSPQKGAATAISHSRSGRGGPSPAGTFRVTGTAAIDVAAHMKLLGESLNNIGHKLKEHEGQIAVSGSLSVLLDSMLCVLGPLMCLTDQVEETKGSIHPSTHAAILDNIAYIMPGIV